MILCVYCVCMCVAFVLSFRSKFLVTKPRQFYYCPCCLFMLWSGIPVAISLDSVSGKEDDWTGISPEQGANCIGPKLIYKSCRKLPELSTTVLCLSLYNINQKLLNNQHAVQSFDLIFMISKLSHAINLYLFQMKELQRTSYYGCKQVVMYKYIFFPV